MPYPKLLTSTKLSNCKPPGEPPTTTTTSTDLGTLGTTTTKTINGSPLSTLPKERSWLLRNGLPACELDLDANSPPRREYAELAVIKYWTNAATTPLRVPRPNPPEDIT
eukprot:6305816-Heterocapsa_arctica.AAC.1